MTNEQSDPNPSPKSDDLSEADIDLSSDPLMQETLASRGGDGDTIYYSSKHLSDYEIIDEIARGGMGVVYRARQINADRIVALKLIRGSDPDAKELERFEAEARAAAKLDHPNIVPIYDVGRIAGEPFFTMKLVEGQSLAKRLDGKPIEAKLAARIVRDIADGMAHAHQNNIVHRDLKPANILLDAQDHPLVTDFGLAKLLDDENDLTRTGQAIGTPSYMPPEQACGDRDRIDHRSDVYALGAILYACLTGRPPFQGATTMATVMAVMNEEPVSPHLLVSGVPKDIETICLKCLTKEPDSRYQTSLDLRDDLERFLNNEPVWARPASAVERGLKWINRNRLATGLIAATVLALLGIAVAINTSLYSEQLADSLEQARLQKFIAERQRSVAEQEKEKAGIALRTAVFEKRRANTALEEAGRLSVLRDKAEYKSQITLAQLAYMRSNYAASQRFLDQTKPRYRDWEHDYLTSRMGRHSRILETPIAGRLALRIARSHDGNTIAVARLGQPATVTIHPVRDQQAAAWSVVLPGAEFLGEVYSFVFLDQTDKRLFISGWDTSTQEHLQRLIVLDHANQSANVTTTAGLESSFKTVAVDQKYRFAATARWDAQLGQVGHGVRIVSLDGQKQAYELDGPGELLTGLFTEDAKQFLCLMGDRASRQQFVGRYDLSNQQLDQQCSLEYVHSDRNMELSPDESRLAMSQGNQLVLLDANSLETLARSGNELSRISAIHFSDDGSALFAGRRSGEVSVYDATTLQSLESFRGLYNPILSMASSPDGELVYCAGNNPSVGVCDRQALSWREFPNLLSGPIVSLALSPDNKQIAVCGNLEQSPQASIEVRRIVDGQLTHAFQSDHPRFDWHVNSVKWVDFVDDGKTLVSASYFNTFFFWNVADGQVEDVIDLGGEGLGQAWLSEDRQFLVACGHGQTADLIDLKNRKPLQRFKEQSQLRVACVDVANRQVHVIDQHGILRTYDWDQTAAIRTHELHFDPPSSAAWHETTRRWVVGTVEGKVRVFDPGHVSENAAQIPLVLDHTGVVKTVSLLPDGKRCLSGCSDGIAVLRETDTLQALIHFGSGGAPIQSAAFSPDGSTLALGTWEGDLNVYSRR